MQDLIKKVNELPLIVKLILCIPGIEIFYGICRILNQLAKPKIDILWLIIAVLTIIPGAAFFWIVDIIWILLYNRACFLD